MNTFLSLLITVLASICTTNGGVLNGGSGLRLQIDSLLTELTSTPMDAVLYWNLVTLQTCANDYDPSVAATPDQLGPTETSRAFAIIHGAMYDSMAAFNGILKPVHKPHNMPDLSNVQNNELAVDAAIMEAAYQTLYALYPKQRPIFDAIRSKYLSKLKTHGTKRAGINAGVLVGQVVSRFILAGRQNDNSQVNVPYTPIMAPGYHQVDPTHPEQSFLTDNWGKVTPFFLTSGSEFRPSNFVGDTPVTRLTYLNSTRYIRDFTESIAVGVLHSTVRTADQTEIGQFWAYDASPKIGVPPRLYNQIVRVVAIKKKNNLADNARLFALVNYAMADAGIAAWDCKYYYNFWRPIVGIRNAVGYTQPDPTWLPLGSPYNGIGMASTPPFPSFVSGHSTFGSAVFESLRLFYKTDNITFRFQSDEFNGITINSQTGKVQPARTRYYQSFSAAEMENFLSRIYLGVHWRSDQEEGKTLGQSVAQNAFSKFI